MKSMTGFGKRESLYQGTMVGVEVRSVNHRFCEMMVRLPKSLSHMELELKEQVKRTCERGRIELTVTMNGGGSGSNKTVKLDGAMARRYVQGLRELQKELKLSGTVDVNVVAGFRDLFSTSEEPTVIKDVPKVVEGLVQRALTDLEKMRKKEGTALQKDLLQRVQMVEERLQVVQQRIPSALQVAADRLKARVAKLLEGERVNDDRIAQEIAMLAERSDVTEELTRLQSHVAQFRSTLKSKEAVGKRLDFLLQEMGREVNTIGSKASDSEISGQVVDLKSELEKIREQVQNIE
ncbi:YicC/YloC family endoribonuclease [uncultured Nitrospira sp.]|uniref:YicC/YloC family endoribonuclease n=1 Tax=uncultured Nitrospira sp. TaxID=157176 RepID=UPI0031408E81